jgi:hypothetical protein
VDNSCIFILESVEGQDAPSTGLSQLLSLIKRSDTVAIKSEGTRIIVNLIRSLWTNERKDEQSSEEELQARQQKRAKAMDSLLTPACAEALAALIGRSTKHVVLINEGVVASSLLSMHRDGGEEVEFQDGIDWKRLTLLYRYSGSECLDCSITSRSYSIFNGIRAGICDGFYQ